MRIATRIKGLIVLFAVLVSIAGGIVLLATPPAEAARCCWVMVCSTSPPYACWEVCKPCPRGP